MKIKKFALLTSLLTSLSLLLLIANEYNIRQELIIRESNQLRSPNSILLKDTFQNLRDNLVSQSRTSVLIVIDENPNLRIIGYYTNDFANDILPTNNNQTFSEVNSQEALVGRNIETAQRGDERFFEHNGKEYEVIGYLGLNNPSFLDNTVLINDLSLFPNEITPLIIDGPNVREFAENHSFTEAISQRNIGINRRIDTDFFSPMMYFFSFSLAFIGTVFLAFVVHESFKQQNKLLYILAIPTFKKYLGNLIYILTVSGVTFFLSMLAFTSDKNLFLSYTVFLRFFSAQLILLIIAYSLLFIKKEREYAHGNDL